MSAVETPSKVAAAALSSIDLNTTLVKSADTTLLAKLKAVAAATPVKPLIIATPTEEVEDYRKRFVGDLECLEKDEPLLKESTSRFVLFPINYREVSVLCSVAIVQLGLMQYSDLADVQTGSS